MQVKLYQTLQRRGIKAMVEKNGPYCCTRPDAWLGPGFYFWENYLNLAHKWGREAHNGNYFIAEADAVLDNQCWDLFGNHAHRMEFCEIVEEMRAAGYREIRVPNVIEYLKKYADFHYQAIRIEGKGSFGNSEKFRFTSRYNAYFEPEPPIQICILNQGALSLSNYRIIH